MGVWYANWLVKECPQIKAMAKKQRADIYFGNAVHIRSDHHAANTWGRKATRPSFKRSAPAIA